MKKKLDNVLALLSLGESQTVEYKDDIPDMAIIGKYVCAFLNGSGGYLICGANQYGDFIGTTKTQKDIKLFEKNLQKDLSPKALIEVEEFSMDGKKGLLIEIPAGKDSPYAFRSKIYVRDGNRTIPADIETVRDMVMRHQIEPTRWERRFSFVEAKDLDEPEILKFCDEAKMRMTFRSITEPFKILEDVGLSSYGRITQGGDVLFGRNPALRYPQIRIRCFKYKTDKTDDTYFDVKSFEGPAYRIFEEAYAFIVTNTPTIFRFSSKNPRREGSPLYPERAVREALVNAIVHRDYASPSGYIGIHVYPHRLVIWNTGSLPKDITADDLTKGKGGLSILQNPDIAHVFYLCNLMEKTGRGSLKMIQACQDSKCPAPTWTTDNSGVAVTFTAPQVPPQVTPQATPQATPQVKDLLKALSGEMTREELMQKMKLKDRHNFKELYLNHAMALGLVKTTIPDKPTSPSQRYFLTKSGQQVLKKKG